MVRQELSARRHNETRDVEFPRRTGRMLQVTVGYYDDTHWEIGEVFIAVDKKAGSDGDVAGRDIAVAISLGLQHGSSLEEQFGAAIKDHEGRPEGLYGIVLERMIAWQTEKRA